MKHHKIQLTLILLYCWGCIYFPKEVTDIIKGFGMYYLIGRRLYIKQDYNTIIGIAFHLTGLRLNISFTTDLMQASVLSYQDSYVDVYSTSWGPAEIGFTVGEPGYLTLQTFKAEAAQVNTGHPANVLD